MPTDDVEAIAVGCEVGVVVFGAKPPPNFSADFVADDSDASTDAGSPSGAAPFDWVKASALLKD